MTDAFSMNIVDGKRDLWKYNFCSLFFKKPLKLDLFYLNFINDIDSNYVTAELPYS